MATIDPYPIAEAIPADRTRPGQGPFRGVVSVVTRDVPFRSATRVWRCPHGHRSAPQATACAAKHRHRDSMWDRPLASFLRT